MPPNHVNAIWTDEQSQALAGFLIEGMSMAENAAAINEKFGTRYSRNAVCGRAYRIGLTAPKKPKVQPEPHKYQPYKPRPKKFNVAYNQQQIQLRCEEVRPDHVALVDLADNGCRWPYGDSPFTFCNQPQLEGTSYCPGHRASSVWRRG